MATLEIELKYRDPDAAAVEARLQSRSAKPLGSRHEQDHYFNAPDRDFALTNEAFRIRRVGEQTCLTYKGRRESGPVKTRREIEVPLGDGEQAFHDIRDLLIALGYRPVALVEKHRRIWSLNRSDFAISVSLDDVCGLGLFAEVEIVTDDARRTEAESVVQSVADELGLRNPEPRSYLRMILEQSESARGAVQ